MNRALFEAPHSSFDPRFWEKLYDLKLNILKLDSSLQTITGGISCSSGQRPNPIEFSLRSHTLSNDIGFCVGELYNVNTVEEFKDYDKKFSLKKTSLKLLSALVLLDAVNNPDLLLTFLLLTYSDLKAYRFTYWLGVPAIVPDQPFNCNDLQALRGVVYENSCDICTELYRLLLQRLAASQEDPPHSESVGYSIQSVFAIKFTEVNEAMMQSGTGSDLVEYQIQGIQRGELLTLAEAWPLRYSPEVFLVVLDPSASSSGFGWIVRNLLAMLALHHGSAGYQGTAAGSVRLIGLRGSVAKRIFTALNNTPADASTAGVGQLLALSDEEAGATDESVLSTFCIEPNMLGTLTTQVCAALKVNTLADIRRDPVNVELGKQLERAMEAGELEALTVVGWETNERGRPGPRVADLSQAMDSRYLMAQAVDLNLRLMKWRLWPALDTEHLATTRCLLLGSGTLGCAVARALLGWGVRDITLVDNGRVSYSNPARQCLFEFEDCEQRSFKATAAAARLRKIFPGVRSEGVVLSIPMPGHPLHAAAGATAEVVEGDGGETISEDEAQFRRLDELVRSHDIVFLLTDSREARWLPTVMCATYNKLLINAALGFDTYLVMRHGQQQSSSQQHSTHLTTATTSTEAISANPRLGCYFCNDIVAATNSQRDRSLDQQCTVTRPGLSFIAAAMGVELMVALMHQPVQPLDTDAEAGGETGSLEGEEEVGAGAVSPPPPAEIPHQIRGTVAGFTQFTPHTPAFSCCTACSNPIVEAYRREGFGFVRQACEDSSLLERTSGVAQLMERVDEGDACFDSEDDF